MLGAASESSRPSASACDAQRESPRQVFPNREDDREGRDEGESGGSVKLVPIDWFAGKMLGDGLKEVHFIVEALKRHNKTL